MAKMPFDLDDWDSISVFDQHVCEWRRAQHDEHLFDYAWHLGMELLKNQ